MTGKCEVVTPAQMHARVQAGERPGPDCYVCSRKYISEERWVLGW